MLCQFVTVCRGKFNGQNLIHTSIEIFKLVSIIESPSLKKKPKKQKLTVSLAGNSSFRILKKSFPYVRRPFTKRFYNRKEPGKKV